MDGDKVMKRRLEKLAGDAGFRKEARKGSADVWGKRVPIMQARTPEKTGKLKRSERMKIMVSSKKEDIRLALIAGGPDVLYARKVHATHKTHSNFMRSVLFESAGSVGREIAQAIDLRRAASASAL